MKAKLLKKLEGFTIIEVMIVLAIAGLIMVIVFIAIPQLQRNQRNQATRDVINRVMAELENFASNNNGNYPAVGACTAATLFGNTAPATAPTGTCFTGRYLSNININDPRTGTPMGLNSSGAATTPTMPATGPRTLTAHMGAGGFVCNGELVAAGTAARQIAIAVALEGGAVYCVDNS